jgi:hypothetical protein
VKKSTVEILLYVLAVSLAALLRLTQLGGQPFTSLEAVQAVQALHLFSGPAAVISAPPLYLAFTGLIFSIFGSSDTAARIVPAIAGIFFVLTPIFLRRKIGINAAMILAFFFAIDPFLIYLSREAGGGMLAILMVVGFFCVFYSGKSVWSGILGMLAILCGAKIFTGIFAILVAGLWVGGRIFINDEAESTSTWRRIEWKPALFAAGITLLTVGLVFLKTPSLINGFGAAIFEAVRGWIPVNELSSQGMISRLMVTFLFLIPLAVILGVTGLIRGGLQKDHWSAFLWRWVLIAFVIVMVYPAHRVTDLVWISIPLWVAAAGEIKSWVHRPENHPTVSYIFAIACSVLLIFCGLKITNLLVYEPGTADSQLAVAGIALTLLMLAVAAFLIGWGWSWKASWFGLGVGLLLVLTIYSIGMARRAAGLGGRQDTNILNPVPIPLENNLLKKTIDDLSLLSKGQIGESAISVYQLDDPALVWALRDYPKTRFLSSMAKGESPELLIADVNASLQLGDSYRGQDFVRSAFVPWSLMTGKEWLNWIIFGDAPLQKQFLILWARNDLFPQNNSSTTKP